MANKQRTNATNFFTYQESLHELDRINFAVSSIVNMFSNGSHERELAKNALLGIRHRIDYVMDSLDNLKLGNSK